MWEPGRPDETAAQRAGACRYWPAKFYSPVVLRICSSMESGSRPACKASPCRRVKTGGPAKVSVGVPPVLFGNHRKTDDLPILLRQYVAGQIVPRVTPEGRLSCSRCIISMITPFCSRPSRFLPYPADLSRAPFVYLTQ
jgi:hypothetical protein